jgi:transposase-like protein
MKQTSGPTKKAPAEVVLKDIWRATRRQFSADEKIRIGLEDLRGKASIAELCRREQREFGARFQAIAAPAQRPRRAGKGRREQQESSVTWRAAVAADGETITVHVPMTFRKRGGRKRVVTPDGAFWAPRP